MIGKIATAIALTMVATMPASAQNGQFVPVLSFRTGPYGGTGAPWANGVIDYYNLVNVRDGGINGVKLLIEECETGFATDKGVECYERLKGKGPTGAAFVNPISTGITYALTEKAPTDKFRSSRWDMAGGTRRTAPFSPGTFHCWERIGRLPTS